jgi:hypothetical protein
MEIKIIIQQTEDGSKVVYPNNYNKFDSVNNKYAFFLKDEGNKTGSSNVYSFQINSDLKAYSLISNEIKDYLGRSGSFFAIRVIIPNQKSIDEIHSLLNNIKDRYMEHYQNKNMAALNFDDLTEAVNDYNFGYNYNSIVTHGIDKEAYVLWDKTDSLNSYFTNKATHIVKCLYIFEKDKTKSEVYERMISFDEVKSLVRKIEITSNSLLESLKVNDVEINIPISNTFDLITTTDTKVTYKRKDKKEFKILNGLESSLALQQEYQAPKEPRTPHSNPNSPKAAIFAFSFLFVLLISVLVWFNWDWLKNKNADTHVNSVSIPQIIEKTENKNTVVFKIIDTTSKQEKRYGIVKPDSLSSYEFIYNNGWSFINKKGKNTPVDFSIKAIKEIFESKKVKFNDTINTSFINELEKISEEKISEEKNEKVTRSNDNETAVKNKKTGQKPAASNKTRPSNDGRLTKVNEGKDNDKANSER